MTETSEKIDEQALRRHDFRGGEAITLDDGQEWVFPKPSIVFRPKFGAPRVGAGRTTDLGPDFDRAVSDLDAALDGRAEGDRMVVDELFHLAVTMLRINYDLSDEQLVGLLSYRPNDESSREMWGAMLDVARGNGPKQMSGMTESQS